jgi:hypothetical protein
VGEHPACLDNPSYHYFGRFGSWVAVIHLPQCGQRGGERARRIWRRRAARTVGRLGCGGGPARLFPPLRHGKAAVLEECVGEHRHEDVAVQASPGAALEVIETEFFLQLLVGLLNGLIANDKFCLARTLKLHLSWPRARHRLKRPALPHLSAEAIPHGAEHATAAHLARPAHRRSGGDRPAALGPGLPASPAVGGGASSRAGRGAGAPDPAGDVPCG